MHGKYAHVHDDDFLDAEVPEGPVSWNPPPPAKPYRNKVEQYLASKDSEGDFLRVQRSHLYICKGNLRAALLLSMVVFWTRGSRKGPTKLRIFRDGHYWLAKTHVQIEQETGLSRQQGRAALAFLVKVGFIEQRRWQFRGKPTTHIRLTDVFTDVDMDMVQRLYSARGE